MANKSNRESLERELFNFKMRCHEYELRLEEVNLHGATGESLQSQNTELLARAHDLETDCESQQAEINNLREICVKTRDGMLDLQKRIEKETEDNQWFRDTNEALQKERDSTTKKYTEACALFKEQEARLQDRLRESEHECSRFKTLSERLEVESKSQKRVIELGQVQISEQQADLKRLRICEQRLASLEVEMQRMEATLNNTIKDRNAQHAEVLKLTESNDQLVEDLERTKTEAKLASERTLALEGERLQIQADAGRRDMEAQLAQLERTLELTREQSSAKSLEYDRLKLRNETLSKDSQSFARKLARLRAEMDNAQEHERQMIQRTKDELQVDMDAQINQKNSELDHQRAELRARLCDKEDMVVNLQARVRQLSIDCNNQISTMEHQMEKLKEEKHRIQVKWNASITAKKRVESVKNGANSTSRPSRARSVGARVRPSGATRRGVTPTVAPSARGTYASSSSVKGNMGGGEESTSTSTTSSTISSRFDAISSPTLTRTPQRVRMPESRRVTVSNDVESKKRESSTKKKKVKRKSSVRQVRSPSPLVSSPSPPRFSVPPPQSSQADKPAQDERNSLANIRAARQRKQQQRLPFAVHGDSTASNRINENNINIENNNLPQPRDDIVKKTQKYLPVKSRVMCSAPSSTLPSRVQVSKSHERTSANGIRQGRLRDSALGMGRRRALSSSASLRPSAMR